MPRDTEEYILSCGLKNALYSIRAADLKADLFGDLIPCSFQILRCRLLREGVEGRIEFYVLGRIERGVSSLTGVSLRGGATLEISAVGQLAYFTIVYAVLYILFIEIESCVIGSATSRLKACLQQICDSTDSASSPSVQLAAIEIKECAEKLNELPEFNEDPALWAQAYSILGGAKQRAMFMACPDNLKKYHWISQELNRVQIVELGASNWFAPAP
ncbi:hypothetical protein Vadar_000539 [Vaccinium darrowii]|uniref:Uncharacterized protein n=1 Tax=Vaccinium darrowii TaxID=229202 RepID=A0ACB7XEJ6_9ERIC|nr:hypothetical protein Vadar_000539 [Vaccinium darrowii]